MFGRSCGYVQFVFLYIYALKLFTQMNMLYKHLTSSIFSRCTLSAKLVHCASLVIVSDFSDYNLQLVLILRNA